MEKRLFLALFLSFLVLIGWAYFNPPAEEPPVEVGGASGQQQPGAGSAGAAGAERVEPVEPDTPTKGAVVRAAEERELVLEIGQPGQPGSYLARFHNRGGRLAELKLGNYYDRVGLSAEERLDREHWTTLITQADTGTASGSFVLRADTSAEAFQRRPLDRDLWEMREITDADGLRGVEFELAQGSGLRWIKRVLFEPGSYDLRVQIEVINDAVDLRVPIGMTLTPAEVVPEEAGERFYIEPLAVAAGRSESEAREEKPPLPRIDTVQRDDGASTLSGTFDVPADFTSFAGVQNKYFAVLLRAADPHSQTSMRGASWRRLRDLAWARENPEKATDSWKFVTTDVLLQLSIPALGERNSYEYLVFAGPKDRDLLVQDFRDHEALVEDDLGFFDGIAGLLLAVLGFFQGLTGNWGVAIFLLTLSVRTLLFPVNRRSQTAMARYQKKMKRLQPQIDELKKRHEKAPDKLRQEQAALMQKEGLFPPLGGCLPVFVQIPIFFGLFQALRTSFDLRQAPFFGWINDLSKPDRLLTLDLHTGLPFIGTIEYLNLLPILMVVLWVLQQKLMPKPTDEQAARMQKMMMFMPVVMGFFLYNYAAGLSIYMITQSFLGIVEIGIIKRVWPVDDTEQVKKPRSKTGFMARLAEKQAEHMKKLQAQQQAAQRKQKGKSKAKGRPRR